MAVALTTHRFTVEEYHLMVKAGILCEDDRVELIRGEVIHMTPIGRHHAGCVICLNWLFSSRLEDRALLSVQNPVPLGRDSEPQPDLALLRRCADFYVRTPLRVEDVFLVIEVADTTAPTDRGVKIPLYAEAGIREAWLVDLAADCVEVYRTPGPNGYRDVVTLRRGQSLAPEAFPDLLLRIDDILG